MKRLIAMFALGAATPALAQTAAPPIAITHAEAWTMESDTPVRDATIIVADGRIVSVTPGGAAPEGATVIDAKGKPVTPGLMNGATQIGLIEVSSSADTRDQASADDRNPGFDPARALNGNSTLVDLARADGLTRALIYPSPSRQPVFSGEPVIARLRDGADILGRGDVAAYAVIGGGAWDRIGSRAQQWAVLRKALTDAKRAGAAGEAADAGKRRGGPPPGRGRHDEGEALRDVIAGEIPLAIQTHRETDIRQAIDLTREFGIRVVIVGGAEAWRVADALAQAKIAVVLDPLTNMPESFDQLGARQTNAAILTAAGVRIAFGMVGGGIHMSYNAGMALREGAGIAVANGLPYADALRAVTINPAAIWGGERITLTPGAPADLVVWDGDPLEPSSIALNVIVEGRTASTRSRQDLLAERYRDAR
ncbi:amidohydrolase family protein [Sphingomonas sp.]|uniref:amidohydrolase family protein n=1 Tax=Sphingomonas sp. TaxID=28214 RepID=UPI001EBC97FB|nr:amidohydrolase family protein [Sphingomonas sp.]MBX3594604.1 amidohydrolase family protein [Sphingomonas sp.]